MRWSEPGPFASAVRGLREGLPRLLTSLPFAGTLLLLLAASALAHRRVGAAPEILLVLLVVGSLAVLWKRRPYPPSRIGFLLAHAAPLPILGGLLMPWPGPGRILTGAGILGLLLGCAWMFYLKPVLKRREAARGASAKPAKPPAFPTLPGRLLGAGLLLAGAALAPHAPHAPVLIRTAFAAATLGAAWALAAVAPSPAALGRLLASPAWDPLQGFLRWTRTSFLLLGAALAWIRLSIPEGGFPAPALMGAWLAQGALLHLHHLKGWKGARTPWAGLAAWALLLDSLQVL